MVGLPEAQIGKQDLLNNQSTLLSNQAIDRLDRGRLEHDLIRRPRPYPYDVTASLTINDGGVADTFGAYTTLIPLNTFDFGDSPNRVQVLGLCICSMSANATYLAEFYKLLAGVYIPLGAVRFRRIGAQVRSFLLDNPCRPFNNDDTALYGRLKTSVATGENIECSLLLSRYIPTDYCIPSSSGVWPWG